jgi:hypothetical protein
LRVAQRTVTLRDTGGVKSRLAAVETRAIAAPELSSAAPRRVDRANGSALRVNDLAIVILSPLKAIIFKDFGGLTPKIHPVGTSRFSTAPWRSSHAESLNGRSNRTQFPAAGNLIAVRSPELDCGCGWPGTAWRAVTLLDLPATIGPLSTNTFVRWMRFKPYGRIVFVCALTK